MTADAQRNARVDAYLDQAVDGNGRAASRLALDLLDQGVPYEEVIVDLLGAAQHEVGERWLANQWTVADEHLASGVTQKALDAVASTAPATDAAGSVIVACAEGDWHSLPAQMFAELLRARGFEVAFLGASTPVDQVVGLLSRRQVDALAISCNLPIFFLGVASLAEAAHRHGVPVLAGGRALGHDASRARRLGVDEWAVDIDAAVDILAGWAQTPPALSGAADLDAAARELEANAAGIAEAAMSELAAAFPQMTGYDAAQLARTREDLEYITRFVAAARLVDEPAVLFEFLAWLSTVLTNRGVPLRALEAGLDVLAPLIGSIDPASRQLLLAARVTPAA